MQFTLQIAGVSIGIEHRYDYIRLLCSDYLTASPPAFWVSVTQQQIEAEQAKSFGHPPLYACEATCLHREIVQALLPYGILLIHSAVVAVDQEAYVFLAKSGVGKSTHINLWRQYFGERATVVNGDKPFFSFTQGKLTVHGSPWRGKELWGQNISLPVKAVCLLERGEENRIRPCSQGEILSKLFHQVLMPTDRNEMQQFLELIHRILQVIPFYRLQCNMNQSAALVAYEGMQKV